MAYMMERWHSAVGMRFSVRKYDGALQAEELQALYGQAEELSAQGVRIVIGESDKAFASLFGTSRIQGTNLFAAFLQSGKQDQMVGYIGEAFVLECTALNISTCWLGMFNKKAVQSSIEILPDEKLTCIAALGIGAEHKRARPRKGLDKLTGLNQAELQALPEWQQHALECARLAPSAMNKQPWRYFVDGETIRVENTGNNFGYGLLDCGITMLHLELGAAHGGVAGEWEYDGNDAVFLPTSYDN